MDLVAFVSSYFSSLHFTVCSHILASSLKIHKIFVFPSDSFAHVPHGIKSSVQLQRMRLLLLLVVVDFRLETPLKMSLGRFYFGRCTQPKTIPLRWITYADTHVLHKVHVKTGETFAPFGQRLRDNKLLSGFQ